MRSMSQTIIALTVMLTACTDGGTPPGGSSPLELSIATAPRVSIGDSATLTMSLRNSSALAYGVRFPGSAERPHISVLVRNEAGDTLWYDEGGMQLQISGRTFAPHERVQTTLVWPLRDRTGVAVGQGTYRLSAAIEVFEGDSAQPKTIRSDEIKIVVVNNLR